MTSGQMSHEEASGLLTWLATGSLDIDERGAVQQHLETCAECRQELAELEALHAMATDIDAEIPEPPSTMKAGMFARIDAEQRSQQIAAARVAEAAPSPSLLERMTAWLSPGGLRVALVAQFALIAILTVGLLLRNDGGFGTAGGPATAATTGRITIAFQPEATAAEIEQLLTDAGATIVEGPTEQGFYTLALPDLAEDAPPSEFEATLEQLRGRTDLVQYAELRYPE